MEQGIRPIGELLTDRSFLMPKTTRSGKNEQPDIMKINGGILLWHFFRAQ